MGRWRDLCECHRLSAGSLLSQVVVVDGVAAGMRRRWAEERGGQLPVCVSWAVGEISLGVAPGMRRRWAEERGEATLGVTDLSWCRGPRRDLVSVAAVAGCRRDPLVSRMGRRRRAKEEGLELELELDLEWDSL